MWIVKSEISFSTSLDDYDQLCIFYVHIDSDAQWIVFIPKDYLVLIAEEDLLCFALLAVQPYRKARNTKQS